MVFFNELSWKKSVELEFEPVRKHTAKINVSNPLPQAVVVERDRTEEQIGGEDHCTDGQPDAERIIGEHDEIWQCVEADEIAEDDSGQACVQRLVHLLELSGKIV